uniref:Zinc finger with UFM1-specific peptidase domain protein n=1 Tax=Macrostomum lignano TaxID=282301 RepID=A0A1I8JA26_9PLAT
AWYSKQRFTVSEDSITNVLWCRPPADQFSSHLEDRGWGCGYRNLQMLLSSMCREPAFLQLVFNNVPQVPSVRKLQQLIEDAWSAGFDPVGRDQLGSRLVNTRKWIGTTEVFALLSFLRVRCRVYDFRRPTGPGGTHLALFEAVKSYYRGRDTECAFPLYLQHEGHSRTVVGMEMRRNGDNRLLLFDPAWRPATVSGWCRKPSNALSSVRCRLTDLRQPEYQLLCVTGTLAGDEDWHRAKSMRGALMRVPPTENQQQQQQQEPPAAGADPPPPGIEQSQHQHQPPAYNRGFPPPPTAPVQPPIQQHQLLPPPPPPPPPSSWDLTQPPPGHQQWFAGGSSGGRGPDSSTMLHHRQAQHHGAPPANRDLPAWLRDGLKKTGHIKAMEQLQNQQHQGASSSSVDRSDSQTNALGGNYDVGFNAQKRSFLPHPDDLIEEEGDGDNDEEDKRGNYNSKESLSKPRTLRASPTDYYRKHSRSRSPEEVNRNRDSGSDDESNSNLKRSPIEAETKTVLTNTGELQLKVTPLLRANAAARPPSPKLTKEQLDEILLAKLKELMTETLLEVTTSLMTEVAQEVLGNNSKRGNRAAEGEKVSGNYSRPSAAATSRPKLGLDQYGDEDDDDSSEVKSNSEPLESSARRRQRQSSRSRSRHSPASESGAELDRVATVRAERISSRSRGDYNSGDRSAASVSPAREQRQSQQQQQPVTMTTAGSSHQNRRGSRSPETLSTAAKQTGRGGSRGRHGDRYRPGSRRSRSRHRSRSRSRSKRSKSKSESHKLSRRRSSRSKEREKTRDRDRDRERDRDRDRDRDRERRHDRERDRSPISKAVDSDSPEWIEQKQQLSGNADASASSSSKSKNKSKKHHKRSGNKDKEHKRSKESKRSRRDSPANSSSDDDRSNR